MSKKKDSKEYPNLLMKVNMRWWQPRAKGYPDKQKFTLLDLGVS
jgi:hypothetical protein